MRNVVCVAEATAAEMRNNAETQTEMSIASHSTRLSCRPSNLMHTCSGPWQGRRRQVGWAWISAANPPGEPWPGEFLFSWRRKTRRRRRRRSGGIRDQREPSRRRTRKGRGRCWRPWNSLAASLSCQSPTQRAARNDDDDDKRQRRGIEWREIVGLVGLSIKGFPCK